MKDQTMRLLFACLACASLTTLGGVVKVKPGDDVSVALDRVLETSGTRELVFLSGEHFLTKPIDLDASASGLIIRGEGRTKTTLSGGAPVSGWTREAGTDFWQAPLPPSASAEVRFLLKGDGLASPARLPAGDARFRHETLFAPRIMSSLQGGWQRQPTDDEKRCFVYAKGDIPITLDWLNADIRLYHMWSASLCTISNVVTDTRTVWTSQLTDWAMGAEKRNEYVLFNVREGMTAPGQWYVDRAARMIHYWPLPNEDVRKLRFAVPVLPSVIRLNPGLKRKGDRTQWVRDVTIRDLTVEAATPTKDDLCHFGGVDLRAAIETDGTERLRIENVAVRRACGTACKLANAEDAALVGCELRELGGGGITFCDWATTGGHAVISNVIADVGLVYLSCAAVYLKGSNCVVRANRISNGPYSGIINSGSDNLYEENRIRHVLSQLHDGAAIYGNLLRCTVRRNIVRDIAPNGEGYGTHAYYADEGSRNCLFESNYAENVASPLQCHMTLETMARNNKFVNKGGNLTISFARSMNGHFEHNTLVAKDGVKVNCPEGVPFWTENRLNGSPWSPERPCEKPQKPLIVDRVASAPTIDGVFAPDEWPDMWYQLMRTADGHRSGFTAATVRFAWDDSYLYAAFMTSAFKDSTISLGDVWGRDDGVELVFAQNRRLRAYFGGAVQVEPASARAAVRVWAGRDPAVTKPWQNPNIGHFELAIPWSLIGAKPRAGEEIPFNAAAFMSELGAAKFWEGLSTGLLRLK